MNTAAFELQMSHAMAPGFGLPEERLARIAERRAFVEMKTLFANAAADVEGHPGRVLQNRVRQATDTVELSRLRAVILTALPPEHERCAWHRERLQHRLDHLFPDSSTGGTTTFVSL